MTAIRPYAEIYGLDISSQIQDNKIRITDGGIKFEFGSSALRPFGTSYKDGQAPRVFQLEGIILPGDETNMELLSRIINSAPKDSKFFPFRADRFCYVDKAQTWIKETEGAANPSTGESGSLWSFQGRVITRDPWFYGWPGMGIAYAEDVSLPKVSALLTNSGHRPARLNYILASGEKVGSSYPENLTAEITTGVSTEHIGQKITLCHKLMRNDLFEIGWRDGIKHSYKFDGSRYWGSVSEDLHGNTSGGSQNLDGSIALDSGDYFMIPFYGPIPGFSASLEVWLSGITGTVQGQYAFSTDLSDMTAVNQTLVTGYNKIDIPNVTSKTNIAFGLKAASGSNSATVTAFRGTVRRSASPYVIPEAGIGDFKIRIEGSGSAKLKKLAAIIYNQYYN